MDHTKVAKAIALQVKECSCSHCRFLVKKALGNDDMAREFFEKYEWRGK